jgi:hypothetical protein
VILDTVYRLETLVLPQVLPEAIPGFSPSQSQLIKGAIPYYKSKARRRIKVTDWLLRDADLGIGWRRGSLSFTPWLATREASNTSSSEPVDISFLGKILEATTGKLPSRYIFACSPSPSYKT